ncbi:MAG TPA: hypothetical protein DER60_01930 [Syntrophomonas sp.]|jgi:hypothetical protein|nr:hypothetical protein [Syntrophomonas sp.]
MDRRQLLMNIKPILVLALVMAMMAMAGCQTPGQSAPPQAAEPGNTPVAPASPTREETALLQEIARSAQAGKVINCDFAVKSTTFDDIEKTWGEPAQLQYVGAAKGTYATYADRKIVFGFNKGMQVFEVRTSAGEVQKLASGDVKEVLGEPVMFRTLGSQQMFGYQAGDYRLEFVFNPPADGRSEPAVDHINVFYPAGTVNMMADDPGRQW